MAEIAPKPVKLPPFQAWLASNIPAVYGNTMSYYDELTSLIKWLETEVVPNVNSAIVLVNQLRNFVENYFDNLDVQEEINNKLDQMAEDGTLQEIIAEYIQANVAWTFDTVADMKLAENLVAGSYARTLGFHSINDNGGALYYISDSGTANEMDVIAVGALYAKLVNEVVLTPEKFGAYCDGSHDDAPYIRGGLAFIDNYGGGTLALTAGKTYLIDSVDDPTEGITTFFKLPDNVTICGKGTIKVAAGYGDYDTIFRYTKALDKVTLKDFTIDDNTTNNPILGTTGNSEGHHRSDIRMISYSTKEINIENITFKDCVGTHQIIIERALTGHVENCVINFNSTASPNYDRTSIYFGCLEGSVSGCKLYGNGNGLTAFELHGKDNILCNNYVEGYVSGVFVTNENIVNENVSKLEVYSNTFKTSRRGIQTWMTEDNVKIDTISIHDNHVVVSGTYNYILGIGNHDLVGVSADVNVYEVYNNVIEMNGTYAQPLRFYYTVSTNNSTIKNLNIHDNNITGTVQYALCIGSTADNKFEITRIDFNRNYINITGATIIIYGTPKLGFGVLNVKENTIESDTAIRLVRMFITTSNIETNVIDNQTNFAMNANNIASGDAQMATNSLVIHRGNIIFNDSSVNNMLPAIKNGSILETVNYRHKRSNDRWYGEYTGDKAPKHMYITKGSVNHLTNDSVIMQIAKNNGYVADHDISTGEHAIGDWVKDGTAVYKTLIANNYTSDAASHPTYFSSVGTHSSFYEVSAS